MGFSHTLTTTADAEAIWAIWTDVDCWSQWDSELVNAHLNGDFCLGGTGQLTPKTGPAAKFVVSQLDWGKSYTVTTQLPLCRLHVHRFLSRCNDDAFPGEQPTLCFTHEVSFEGMLSPVFSALLGSRFQRVLPGVMASVNALALSGSSL